MFHTIWQITRQTWTEFSEDKVFRLAAALAYYTALSLAPMLLVVISIAGMIYGEQAARGEVVGQLQDLVGQQGAEAIQSMLASSTPKDGGIVSLVVGAVTLLIGATGVFAQLQDALNTVWDVDEAPSSGGGILGMLRDRLLSFSLVCGMAFLLLVSMVISALMSGLNEYMQEWLPRSVELLWLGNVLLTGLLTFLLFAMIFKFLPAAAVRWSDVWIGAALTTVLFVLGKHAIGLYLGQVAMGNTFGAAGSFVVLLMWLYYSSAILLFGAEFTQVYASRHRARAEPAQSPQSRGETDNTSGEQPGYHERITT